VKDEKKSYPKVTIVTPSYNQGKFLEETIRSVLSQDYPNIEYIVMDGGSTDDSVEIIKKYADKIAFWTSEKDNGQADAINKGFRKSTGDILAWLNSDDIYTDDKAISRVVEIFNAEHTAGIVSARCIDIDENGKEIGPINISKEHINPEYLRRRSVIIQPGSFFKKEVVSDYPLNNALYYVFDWDFFIRASEKYKIVPAVFFVAACRQHKSTKTLTGGVKRTEEISSIFERYKGRTSWQYRASRVFYRLYLWDSFLPGPMKGALSPGIRALAIILYKITGKRIIII